MPVLRFQIEVHTIVYAAIAEVTVKSATIVEAVHQLAQFAQILAQLFRRHRRVFPAFPGEVLAGNVGNYTQA